MTTTALLDPALQSLLDRDRIQRLVHEVGRCLDEGRFEDLRLLYTEDAVARTPGGEAEGADALVAQARRAHTRTPHVHHLISDVLVDLAGDEADVRANLLVTFTDDATPPAPRFQLGEIYRFRARREPQGWRLASVTSKPVWAVGERP